MRKATKFILIPVLVVMAVLLAMSAVQAYTINDTTKVIAGWTSDNISHGERDSIGDYNVYGINLSYLNGNLMVDLFTNFSGMEEAGGVAINYADLALDLNGDKSYEYGVVLSSRESLTLGAIYKNPTWNTSHYYLEYPGKAVGTWEYGEFLKYVSTTDFTYVNTHISKDTAQAEKIAMATLSQPFPGVTGSEPRYLLELSIPIADLVWTSGEVGIFWAGATCGNDIIEGSAPVPEPATMLLLGTGLIGLAGFGRKRLLKKS